LRQWLDVTIASGAGGVKASRPHASAKTTRDTYSHLWPDEDEFSRAAVAASTLRDLKERAEGARMDRLEDVPGSGESVDDVVLILHGCEDTAATLLRQAGMLEVASRTTVCPAPRDLIYTSNSPAWSSTITA
jgi:hypothetical protein